MKDCCFLDLGNTRYKWMMQSELPDGKVNKAMYARTMPADALACNLLEAESFERLLVASVKDLAFNEALSQACSKVGGPSPEFISIPEYPLISLAYKDISQFGVDRYLDLMGALRRYRAPFVVVDAGTAVTFDAVDHSGRHIGGCIYPGRGMLYSSLIRGADQIAPGLQTKTTSSILADSTEGGVNVGVEQGFVAAIDGILNAMLSQMADSPTVLLTGGDADWLCPRLGFSVLLDSSLIFEGIGQVTKEALNKSPLF
jgi:type III pantothenate kinase